MLKQAAIGMPTRELAWKKYSFLGFGEKLQNSHQRPSPWEEFESLHSLSLKSCCRSKVRFFSSFEKKKKVNFRSEIGI